MSVTLREARKRAGLTQDKLAAKSGVDQTSISRLETTASKPTDDTRNALAKALGIAPSKLRFSTPDPAGIGTRESDRVGHTRKPREALA